jgi:predicted DNA-binding transcriptional regulator AlpA
MPVHIGEAKAKHPRSIDGFCERNGICRASFYNLVKQGRGPRTAKLGSGTVIFEDAEIEWRRRMEEKSTPTKAP